MATRRLYPAQMAAIKQQLAHVTRELNALAQERELTADQVDSMDDYSNVAFHDEACRRAGVRPHGFCIAL